ncbi:MAG: hypothetical protein ABFC57_07340 [Veillonellales bacterium]
MTNEEFQKLMLEQLQGINTRLNGLDNRLENVEGQLGETNGIVKALMHRTEELDAKFDGLLHTTATKDAVERVETKIDILTHRVIAQDGEIQLLKKAK